MWIIAIIMFNGYGFKVASNQLIYETFELCEPHRIEMTNELNRTAPQGGMAISRCVNMTPTSV